jgi:predicted Zn-dependent peptidase
VAVLLFSFLLLAAFGIMTENAVAQIDRTRRPAADPAPKASFPKFEQFTLANGLRVYFVHDPRPVVTFRLQLRGGASTDAATPGLSAAAAELLTKGTTARSAQEFAQRIDFVGGSIGGSSSPDMVSVSASGLRKHVATILELFSEAVLHPAYSEEELVKYKQEQITGLKAASADPSTLANNAVNRVLFGTTTYGLVPTEASISSLTREGLASYHREWFVPSNATLAVVGDFELPALKKMLEGAFGDWKKGSAPKISTPKFPTHKKRMIVLVDRPTSVQSSIRVIGEGPLYKTPDRPMATLLNSILGGGGLSDRLTHNLRETHSYTYTPYSYFAANLYEGYWVAGADVRNEVTDSALAEILFEVERIQKEDVPAEELTRHVQSAVGRFLMSIAEPNVTAERVQFLDFYGLPKDYYNRLVGIYTSTTPKHIRDLGRRYLAGDRIHVVVVGKASEVKEKLEKFGPVVVWDTDMNPVAERAAAAGLPSAEEVYAKMLDARGGKRKLQAITSLRTTGPISLTMGPQSIPGTVTNVSVAPNKRYIAIELTGMGKVMEQINNGTRVLVRQMGQQKELQGAELERALESSKIVGEAWALEMGGKLAVRPGPDVNNVQTIALEITLPKSGSTVYYLDPNTWLPIRSESSEGEVFTLSDWVDVGEGIKLPRKISMDMQGTVVSMYDLKNELNVAIDEAQFNVGP